MTQATALATAPNTTDSITSGEWSSVLKLVENGVPSAVIAASTKTTPFRSLRVTNPVKEAQRKALKEAENGEGGGE